jgi:hypothetical protein
MDSSGHFNSANAWQTKAFNSQFTNSVPINPEDFPVSPFGGLPIPALGSFFPQQDMIQYDEVNGNCDFQPEVGLYNGAFMQNQFVNSQVSVMHWPQFSIQPPNTLLHANDHFSKLFNVANMAVFTFSSPHRRLVCRK